MLSRQAHQPEHDGDEKLDAGCPRCAEMRGHQGDDKRCERHAELPVGEDESGVLEFSRGDRAQGEEAYEGSVDPYDPFSEEEYQREAEVRSGFRPGRQQPTA
jgi:hypothetical protein